MPSSAIFTGSGFFINGAFELTPGTIRIKYSSKPKAVVSTNIDDALNPTNYTLTGPSSYIITNIIPVSGDYLSFDLLFSTPLSIGTWEVTVSNVLSVLDDALTSPFSAIFNITSTATRTSLSAGAENDDAEKRSKLGRSY